MKSLLFFLSLVFFFSCNKDLSSINPTEESTILPGDSIIGKLPFRTHIQRSTGFGNSTELPELIVLRSKDEEALLGFSILRYNHYKDSMLVGIIYGPRVSVSTNFEIDSLVADSTTINVYSHLYNPLAQMPIYRFPNHFVSVPKSTKNVVLQNVQVINETLLGDIIPFRTFFKEIVMIQAEYDDEPKLIVLRSKEDELAFLDTTETAPAFIFPEFDYTDSMLVGIKLPEKYSSGQPYDILMVTKQGDNLNVIFHIWFPIFTEPDLVAPGHFIALEKMDVNVRMAIEYLW